MFKKTSKGKLISKLDVDKNGQITKESSLKKSSKKERRLSVEGKN